MEQETILVAETEQTVRETIAFHLRREGYTVLVAASEASTLAIARQGLVDLLLLDFLLPADTGDLFRQLQAAPQTASLPIVWLLPRRATLLDVAELEVQHHLVKPFSWKELRVLIRTILRRSGQERRTRLRREAAFQEEVQVFLVGNLRIDVDRREVTKGGHPVELKARLFDLLVYLARYPNIVLTYDRLLSQVWGSGVSENSKTLYVHIRWLREKLEDDPAHPRLIETVYGVGYRFNGESAPDTPVEMRR